MAKAAAKRSERALGAQGERTRRRLLDAAKVAFTARGFAQTRVDDIAAEAGTSHGAFYLYFSNKQDVLETLAGETAERMYALAEDLGEVTPGEEGFARLRAWIASFVDAYVEHAPVVNAWTQAADDDRFDRLGRQVLGTFAGTIRHAIERAIGEEARHPVHAGIAATALVAMLERICYFWVVRGAAYPRDEAIDTLTAIWYEAIFGRR